MKLPNPALASVVAKLDRAKEHTDDVYKQIADYLAADPLKPVLNYQADGETVVVEVHLRCEAPLRLSATIGDAINNLRSALDHLTCQLVGMHNGQPTWRTQFPILSERLTDGGKLRRLEVDGGVSDSVLAVIERVQPFHWKDDPSLHPLAILQELSNIDKHRKLHVAVAQPVNTVARFEFPNGRTLEGATMTEPKFVDSERRKAMIMAVEFGGGYAKLPSTTSLELEGEVYVALAEAVAHREEPIVLLLDELHDFLRADLLPQFAEFF